MSFFSCLKHCGNIVKTLRYECEHQSLYEAWQAILWGINEWYTNWPHLMKLWQYVFVILSNITICEHGFSKHNANKSRMQTLSKFDIWML